MTSINLLKVAALPGSGSGCQSALPAEVGKGRAPIFVGVDMASGPAQAAVVTVYDIAERIALAKWRELIGGSGASIAGVVLGDPIPARRVVLPGEAVVPAPGPDLLDAAGGGE